jgi:putative tryptophan/tyrosine transport system substrate-binding protein
MTTIALLMTLALGLLVAPLAAETQQSVKVHRIGLLRRAAPQAAEFQAFRHGLHALGYREGHNLVIEQRSAHGVPERLPALAAELVQ